MLTFRLMSLSYNIFSIGDHALTIELGNSIDETINHHCLSLAVHLKKADIPGVKDIIPAYCTVSVIYDPLIVFKTPGIISPFQYITSLIEKVIDTYEPSLHHSQRKMSIPVCFDNSFACDIERMVEAKKLSAAEIISLFINRTYRVYLTGFLPGFSYMGKVDDVLATARKEKPHLKINAGSVGIAGSQAGIYPLQSPGGWNIIGRTPLRLFDKHTDDPCLLQAGDEVTFYEISLKEFNELNQNN